VKSEALDDADPEDGAGVRMIEHVEPHEAGHQVAIAQDPSP
jgi:hypothetical protein